jgi:peptidoglycan L-alanyl-D-glutamate endopeptidase CwlK
MSRRLEDLDPRIRPLCAALLAAAKAAGLPLVLTTTFRTRDEQQDLYDQGRSVPGRIVTNARPGESPHNAGLAFDVAFAETLYEEPRPGAWDELGAIGLALGLQWGGRFLTPIDRPHFEWRDWRASTRKDGA